MGLFCGPAFITLHEVGHAVAAVLLGGSADIGLMSTALQVSGGTYALALVTGAGPLMDLLVAVGGWAWFTRRRQKGRAFALRDWFAVAMICVSLRWVTRVPLRYWSGSVEGRAGIDEIGLAQQLGLLEGVIAVPLAVCAIVFMVGAVRRLPVGSRLWPMVCLLGGEASGVAAMAALAR